MFRVGSHRFTTTDARRTLLHLGDVWRHQTAHLTVPPAQVAEQAADLARRVADAVGLEHVAEPDAARALDRAGRAAADRLGALDPDEAVALLSLGWSGIRTLGRAVAAASVADAHGQGQVTGVFVSAGGVPKTPIAAADVGYGGMVGDSQATRVHHGSPWQALCLWSGEVIDAFAADGHPLDPGAAGENVTIRGLDWSAVRPGRTLRIGDVTAELSAYAIPCSKNARWFRDGEFSLMHHNRGPVSRVYATVVEPGRIALGDEVLLEP